MADIVSGGEAVHMHRNAISAALLLALHFVPAARAAATDLFNLAELPVFRDGTSVASFSSYDRTGGNDDGFSGKHSFLRKEGDRLVIAEMKGPGQITRIWTPTPTDDLVEFFFDGETEPRIRAKFNDLFSGRKFPFLRPIVGMGAGGFYSYVPLTYRESCKVTIKAEKVQFYQVNYSTFASGQGVQSFDPKSADAMKAELAKAAEVVDATGSDISEHVIGATTERHAFSETLKAGSAVTLFESKTGGRVGAIKIAPASALAGAARGVLLNVYYDGATTPSFSCPAGDFFGFSFGQPAMRSLMIGTDGDACYSYWPMPFEKGIRFELASDDPKASAFAIHGEVVVADRPRAANEGMFYAVWNRENPTKAGTPFTFIDMQGKGHVVGVALQAQGPEAGAVPEFFEGDDQTTIDGKLVIHGTGSEDFFNGGWYDVPGRWEDRVLLPFSGCLDYKRYLGRTGAYRLMLNDAYTFNDSIRQTIEHGPEGNKIITDYTGVTYVYADRAPTNRPMPTQADRAVTNPRRVVFAPGMTMPIYAFSRDNASVTKHEEKVGEHNERFLSLVSNVREVKDGNQFLTLVCDVPEAGNYRVFLDAIVGPESGIVQMIENEYPQGERHDLYAAARATREPFDMGTAKMHSGDNRITLKLVGKNPAATGYRMDLRRVICERVD